MVAMSCAPPVDAGESSARHSPALPRQIRLGLHVNNSELTPVGKYSYQESLDSWDWEKIPADVDQVVVRWWDSMHDRQFWNAMAADDRLGYVRAVVSELLNEARHPSDGIREYRLRRAAHAHGSFRRRQRCDCTGVGEEMYALEGAIEATMLAAGHSPGLVRDYLVLLGADVELARDFAVRGWGAGEALRSE